MQMLPITTHPKYGCIKKAPFTKNTANNIKPIIINKPPNVFIFLFYIIVFIPFLSQYRLKPVSARKLFDRLLPYDIHVMPLADSLCGLDKPCRLLFGVVPCLYGGL